MGFFGDVLGDILDSGSGSFGQRIRSDNQALMDLYRTTYFDFGLAPVRNLKENQLVPMTVVTSFGSKILAFEIHGNIHSPINFLSRGWGSTFHTITREMTLTKDRVWAYDIRRLDESILIGSAVYPGDEAYKRSEEYLKILHVVGGALIPPLLQVPAIELEFGSIWEQFGVPDSISVTMKSMYPIAEHFLRDVINLILHAYNRSSGLPVTVYPSLNAIDGTITLEMRENSTQPPMPTRPPESKPEPESPDDDFPYDFYRGLGLIDDEDLVTVPSMLGPVKSSMRNPLTKQYLLEYKPDAE